LGIEGTDEMAAQDLRRAPWQDIVRASSGAIGDPRESLPSDPVGRYLVLDGEVLEQPPGEVFAAGRQAAVPLLVGTVADEGTLFAAGLGISSVSEYQRLVASLFPEDPAAILALYPATERTEVEAVLGRLLGDLIFQREARRLARFHAAAEEPVYRYVFARAAPAAAVLGLGAFHGSEIPYVFGTTERAAGLARDGVEEADRELSERMMGYWIRFAQTGDPNGDGAPEWPLYEADQDNVLVLDVESRVEHGFRSERLDLLEREFREERQAAF
jgi:para-nitrobenzyl esterase